MIPIIFMMKIKQHISYLREDISIVRNGNMRFLRECVEKHCQLTRFVFENTCAKFNQYPALFLSIFQITSKARISFWEFISISIIADQRFPLHSHIQNDSFVISLSLQRVHLFFWLLSRHVNKNSFAMLFWSTDDNGE